MRSSADDLDAKLEARYRVLLPIGLLSVQAFSPRLLPLAQDRLVPPWRFVPNPTRDPAEDIAAEIASERASAFRMRDLPTAHPIQRMFPGVCRSGQKVSLVDPWA